MSTETEVKSPSTAVLARIQDTVLDLKVDNSVIRQTVEALRSDIPTQAQVKQKQESHKKAAQRRYFVGACVATIIALLGGYLLYKGDYTRLEVVIGIIVICLNLIHTLINDAKDHAE